MDAYDRKILFWLDHNARATLSELAKHVRLSKNAIHHRIQQLTTKRIIKQNYALINTKNLGYEYFKVYLKLQNLTDEIEQELIRYTSNDLPSLWVASWDGSYDLMAGLLAKDTASFSKILRKLLNTYGKYILRYDIFIVITAPHFPRTYLLDGNQKDSTTQSFTKIAPCVIDETDNLILKTIATNARKPVTWIAQKTKLAPETIRYRLQQLKKQDVIQGYRLLPDYKRIGIQVYKALITMNMLDETVRKKILSYCQTQPSIVDVITEGIGPWDIELQLDVENQEQAHHLLREFKNLFGNYIQDYQLLLLREEHKLNYYPFP